MGDFRRLRVWELAHKATLRVYKLSEKLPKSELFGLISQIRRAAVSVELNIAEGEGRFSRKEKVQFFYMARASSIEVMAALLIIADLYPDLKEEAMEIYNDYETFGYQLNSLIGYRKKH